MAIEFNKFQSGRSAARKFPDLLTKLGILRYGGVAGTYRSGTECPTELLIDDVAKRDLTTKDIAALREAVTGKVDATHKD